MSDSQRWMVFGFVLVCAGLIYVLKPILMPFAVAALLAYLGDPVADKFETWGWNRTLAVCAVFTIMILFLIIFLLLIIPAAGQQLDNFVRRAPDMLNWLQTVLMPALAERLNMPDLQLPMAEVKSALIANWQKAGNVIGILAKQVTTSGMAFVAWMANLVLIPVVAFYLLRDWDVLMGLIRESLPRRFEPSIVSLAGECDEVLSEFLRGQLLVMFLLGLLYAVGLWIVGVDGALLLGLIAGMASIVPYMGVVVGVVVSGIAAYAQFQEFLPLVWVGVVFGIGQMVEGMVLTPLLVGDRVGLHPVAVIFAILAGGQLYGFLGILLAVPVAAVIMVMLRHLHDRYKNSELYG